MHYEIIIRNTGAGPAYEVEVHDPIPEYIINPSGAASGQIWADEVYWLIDILQPGESRTLTWDGSVDPTIPESKRTIVNKVTVQDVAGNIDQAEATSNILKQDLLAIKDASYLVYPGSTVAYTVTVSNRGNSTLYVLISDPIPDYVLDPQNISGGGRFDGNTQVIWEIPSLAAGQSLDIAWQGIVDPNIPPKSKRSGMK